MENQTAISTDENFTDTLPVVKVGKKDVQKILPCWIPLCLLCFLPTTDTKITLSLEKLKVVTSPKEVFACSSIGSICKATTAAKLRVLPESRGHNEREGKAYCPKGIANSGLEHGLLYCCYFTIRKKFPIAVKALSVIWRKAEAGMSIASTQDHKLPILSVLAPDRAKPRTANPGTGSKGEGQLPSKLQS